MWEGRLIMLEITTKSYAPREEKILSRREEVSENHKKLHSGSMPMTGWVDLPATYDNAEFDRILAAGEEIRNKYSALVVIGVGGSYLGTRCCYELLTDRRNGVKLFFAGWNLSAGYHRRLLKKLESHNVAVCVVSKSGTTTETALAFDFMKAYLKERYGEDYKNRIYVVTDGEKGALRRESDENGYCSFALNSEIGGRYSVLTAVGMLPLAAAGIDVSAVMKGAKLAYEDLLSPEMEKNPAYYYAAYRNVLFGEGKHTEFYSFSEPEMFRFGYWLKQLFAESEGKDNKGIYPSVLNYSTDLHSVGQYLEQGNPVFFETMVTVRDRENDIVVPGHEKTYHDHINAVTEAVYRVRNARKTPLVKMTFDALDEECTGYAVYFFEKACAMSCMLMGVNPFDQPGVEAYKREMREILKTEK